MIALGAPIWVAILVSIFAIIFSLYVSLWALVVSCWAVFVSFSACAVAGVVGIFFSLTSPYTGIVFFGAGLALAGLAILTFFVCKRFTKLSAVASKKGIEVIAKYFSKKEAINE